MKKTFTLFSMIVFILWLALITSCNVRIEETLTNDETTVMTSQQVIATKKIGITSTSTLVTSTENIENIQTEAPKNKWLSLSLPLGEYIYLEGHSIKNELIFALYSLNTSEMSMLPNNGFLVNPLGRNGSFLLYELDEENFGYYKTISLSSFKNTDYTIDLPTNCWYRDITSDEEYLLVSSCTDLFDTEIGVLEKSTGEIIQLTFSDNPTTGINRNLGEVSFSPDGKWILYFDIPYHNNYEKEWGLYLMPTSCINTPEACKDSTLGPFWVENMYMSDEDLLTAWSPDSRQIVMPKDFPTGLMIFDLTTHEFTELDMRLDFMPVSLNWLYNSNQITFVARFPPTGAENVNYIYDLAEKKLDMMVLDIPEVLLTQWFVID